MSAQTSSLSSTSRASHRENGNHDDNDGNVGVVELKHPESVQDALRPHWERHQQAQIHRDKAKQACARELAQLQQHHKLVELQADSRRLRAQLQQLKASCANMAVRVASQAVENDSKQESSFAFAASTMHNNNSLAQHYESLERLEDGLLQTSMHQAIQVATQQVRALRFQWARKALAMYRLVIDPEDVKSAPIRKPTDSANPSSTAAQQARLQRLQRRAKGIGKIGGLPLPHAGPELYGVLPPRELQSALRLVASVTWTVARCLGIILPHPILLTPHGTSGDIAQSQTNDNRQTARKPPKLLSSSQKSSHTMPPTPPTLTSAATSVATSAATSAVSLLSSASSFGTSLLKKGAKKAYSKATGYEYSITSSSRHGGYYAHGSARSGSRPTTSLNNRYAPTGNSYPYSSSLPSTPSYPTHAQPSIATIPSSSLSHDRQQLQQRIHHATAAVLCDDVTSSASAFTLSPLPEVAKEEDFAIALQLLQNNIICLCIRTGVPISQLWPAEAILLNLYALDQYCQQQIAVDY